MKKRDIFIAVGVIAVALLSVVAVSQDELSWGGVLAKIYNSSNDTLQVSIVDQAQDLDISEETALTNTVNNILTLTHTTSGSPAANIGVGVDYIQETSASNNETVLKLDAVIDDATAASEDASFSVKLMEAGAAAAEKFAIESTGVVTLDGAATLDNSTSATDLNITETTVTLTASGGVTASADVTVTDDLTVGGWATYPSTTISAQSYTISSTGKSSVYISEHSDTAASTIFLPDTPADGTWIVIKDGDLNANTNNIVVATEGSDTVDESASYTMDADGEALEVVYDAGGTDWNIIGGYGE